MLKKCLSLISLCAVLILMVTGSCQAKNREGHFADNLWRQAAGFYELEGSAQYSNGRLQLKPLDNGCVFYEFNVMKGSEKEDQADSFSFTGTFSVNKDGTGDSLLIFNKKAVQLHFVRNKEKVTVTQKGELKLSVQGNYLFSYME